MKTKKIIVAGPLVREVIYSRAAAREPARVRQAKRKVSSEAQQRANARCSWEKLELMLAANFVPGDLVVTLTFDNAHLPKTRNAAAARCKKFRSAAGEMRKKAGSELRMIWALENKSDDGRWHVHAVLNATDGQDYEEIRKLWPWGQNIEIRKLQIGREKNYETLARYMCKEARERPGLRSWSYTRNCRHPETEIFPVSDDTRIEIPEGATVIQEETKRTEWAEFQYVKYLAVNPVNLRRRRQRKRRQR